MEDQTKVAISLDAYKDFVIYEHEQGKLKKGLTQEINELQAEKEERLKDIEALKVEAKKLKDAALDILFRRERMGKDTRAEQTQLGGQYFGFDIYKREYLTKELGYTDQDLIEYIKKQWDEKEASEKEEDL